MRESYNSVEVVYRRARARGMDLVAITDHDSIEGVLQIADRQDVIIGCEVTAVFPRDRVRVHLGVLGLNEAQHRETQRLRHGRVARVHGVNVGIQLHAKLLSGAIARAFGGRAARESPAGKATVGAGRDRTPVSGIVAGRRDSPAEEPRLPRNVYRCRPQ
ncbi:MAG TPA: hypothetical protein VK595_14470 [Vicinamibacterales bacterium]|nr:hypothetical protein [Vicinamibacterales bacterium]